MTGAAQYISAFLSNVVKNSKEEEATKRRSGEENTGEDEGNETYRIRRTQNAEE